jgi:hypothetical protein
MASTHDPFIEHVVDCPKCGQVVIMNLRAWDLCVIGQALFREYNRAKQLVNRNA